MVEHHAEPSGERYARIEPLRAGQEVALVALPAIAVAITDVLPARSQRAATSSAVTHVVHLTTRVSASG